MRTDTSAVIVLSITTFVGAVIDVRQGIQIDHAEARLKELEADVSILYQSLQPGTPVVTRTGQRGEIVRECGMGYWCRMDGDDVLRFFFVTDLKA